MTAAFTGQVRATVRNRAGFKCELCGQRLDVGTYHHRRPRAMGSTKRLESAGPQNCLLLHIRCHRDVEDNRQRALDNGWLVRQNDDPAAVKVKLWSGWHYLTPEGGYQPA